MVLVATMLLCAIFGAQALARTSESAPSALSPTRAMGDAGFAYLSGLRTFVAAILWTRLEPQFHQYYRGVPVDKRLDFLPTIRLVQALNPQFEQSYYYVAFILAQRGQTDDAIALSEQGLKNCPRSGLIRATYIEVLRARDKKSTRSLPLQLRLAREGTSPSATFASDDDKLEAYGVFHSVLVLAGDSQAADKVQKEQQRLAGHGAAVGRDSD